MVTVVGLWQYGETTNGSLLAFWRCWSLTVVSSCDQDMKDNHQKLSFYSPPIPQGEGYNCQTNETSGDGSWSNVASQRDWILDQMQPEKRTGSSEVEDICKYLPNIHKNLHQIANICDQRKSDWLEEVRTSRGNLRRETFMLGELAD